MFNKKIPIRIKKILALVLSIGTIISVSACTTGVTSTLTKEDPPMIKSKCAVVENLKTGEIVYERNADEKTRPASMAKIMVVIYALDHMKSSDMDIRVATLASDYDYLKTVGEYESAGFEPGEKATLRDYLYGMMFESQADAAMTVARYFGDGSLKTFAIRENAWARRIGMYHSHFDNPIGVDSAGNYGTCLDYARLVRYAMNNKEFRKIFDGVRYTIKADNKRSSDTVITQSTHDETGDHSMILGGKTGYTPLAKKCLASNTEIDGVEYICVSTEAKPTVFNEYPNISDHEALYRYIRKNSH